jgi:ribonuclease R
MDKIELTEEILKVFGKSDTTYKLSSIAKALKFKSDSLDYQKLKKTLLELCDQNVIEKSSRNRYSIVSLDYAPEIKGVLQMRKDTGAVETNIPEYSKIIIKRRNLNTALDGDTVTVKLQALKEGRKARGEVTDIIKRAKHIITGTIEFDSEYNFLVPDEEKYYVDFLIPDNELKGATDGNKVKAVLTSWEDPSKSPKASVLGVIGEAGKPAVEFDSIVDEYNLDESFPDDVNAETKKVPKTVSKQVIASRLDLRQSDIITIDPEDAKDFDDALSLEILENGNYYLGVHIADVSHYVAPGGAIDEEAYERGTSTYLVDRVVPMLPEALSNTICSLMPNRIRCTYTVFMEYTPNMVLASYAIRETVIKSKKRFTYDQVQEIIEGKEHKYSELLLKLHELANKLRKKRFNIGGVNFQTNEVRFKLDEDKKPITTYLKSGNDATSLVEECMLAANRTIAEHVRKQSKKYKIKKTLPFLYRVHDEPDKTKISDALKFFMSFTSTKRIKAGSSKDINQVLKTFEGKPEKNLINDILVRSMAKAEYSEENIGHYGLGFKEYAHFTSPIRRYPDLVVHRMLKMYAETKPDKKMIEKLLQDLADIGQHATARERVAMEAERSSIKVAHAMQAKSHVGEEYDGTISGITSFGIFVIMDEIYAEGLLHIRDMRDDYYLFDEKNYRLVGRRKKRVFQFGSRIRVKIVKVNIEKRRIDLEFIDK